MLWKRKEKKQDKKADKNKTSLVKTDNGKVTGSEKVKHALKVRFALEQEPKVDMYFYRIYRKLRLVRYACVLFAALFVMSVPMVYSDQITTENFKYLLKYIDMQLTEDTDLYSEFAYEASDNMHFGVYAEDIVVCTDTSLVYYDKLGNESFRASFGPYKNAQLLISDKYVMVYDRGGNEYAVFNSYKRVHHATTEYPITLCALSDSGRYAILSSNRNYLSELTVYSANFQQVNRVQKDMYISSIFFHDETDEFGYTSFTTDEKGGKLGEICYYDRQSKKTVEIVSNDIPLDSAISENLVRVLYADRVVWYTKKGEEKKVYPFASSPTSYCYSPGRLAVCIQDEKVGENGCIQIIGVDTDKNLTVPLQDTVNRTNWYEGNFYCIGRGQIQRIDTKGNVICASISENAVDLIFLPSEQMMVCYPDRTELISFSEAVA